jgi:peptidoglycan/LPS O-acetylase OafA/YrhL
MPVIFWAGIFLVGLAIVMDVLPDGAIPFHKSLHFYFPLLTHFPLFLAGIAFYHWMKKVEMAPLREIIVLGICFGAAIFLFDDGGRNFVFLTRTEYIIPLSVYFVVFILFVSRKLGFIAIPPFLFGGKISYSLYLIHHYLGIHILVPGFMNKLHWNFWVSFVVSLVIVLLLSSAISLVVEHPVDRWLNRNLRKGMRLPEKRSPAQPISG